MKKKELNANPSRKSTVIAHGRPFASPNSSNCTHTHTHVIIHSLTETSPITYELESNICMHACQYTRSCVGHAPPSTKLIIEIRRKKVYFRMNGQAHESCAAATGTLPTFNQSFINGRIPCTWARKRQKANAFSAANIKIIYPQNTRCPSFIILSTHIVITSMAKELHHEPISNIS